MNYESYLQYENNYTLDFSNEPLMHLHGNAFYTDGTQANFLLSSVWSPLYRMSFVINNAYLTAQQNGKSIMAMMYPLGTTDFLLITPSNYDFIKVNVSRGTGNPSLSFTETKINSLANETPSLDQSLNDYIDFGLYGRSVFYDYYEEATYVHYSGDIDSTHSFIYDFTSLREDQVERTNAGLGIHLNALKIEDYNSTNNSITLGVGSPFASIRESAYTQGESAGYNNGYNTGYTNGFNDGVSSASSVTTLSAFDVIGRAFDGVATILSLEVLPNITLGLCFSIPMTFILIMVIFKLVKK